MLHLNSIISRLNISIPSAILLANLFPTNGLAAIVVALPEATESEQIAQQADPNRERFIQDTPEVELLPSEPTETEPVITPPTQ